MVPPPSPSPSRRRRRSKKPENEVFDYSKLERKELQNLGQRDQLRGFDLVAGARNTTVRTWLPRLLMLNKLACGVAILGFLSSVWFIVHWPDPTLLLSFPDGSVRCAPPSLNPVTAAPMPRTTPQEARLCAALENYGGNRDTENDATSTR